MTVRVRTSLRWLSSGNHTATDHRGPARRRVRHGWLDCETLEGRVVLSGFGGGLGGGGSGYNALLQDLNELGVITSPVVPASMSAAGGQSTQLAQLQKDEQTLQTEFQTLSANSGVTVKDLTQLETDAAALGTAWFGVSGSSLQKALSDLAAAATGSTTVTTASAQSEFTGLFPSADATAAGAVFTDLNQVVTDSAVGATGLSTVASDQAVVKSDVSNLNGSGGNGWFGLGGTSALTSPVSGIGGFAGSSVLYALNNLGVIASPVVASQGGTGDGSSSTSSSSGSTEQSAAITQLRTDEQALQAELQTLSSGSGVTVGDLTHLEIDAQTLGTAWRAVSASALQQALGDLAAAATGSTTVSATQAQTEFTGLFPTSDQSAATTVYNDIVQIVKDSGVTSSALTTVAADETAIKTDLTNLRSGNTGSSSSGSGSTSSTTTTTGSTTGTGSTSAGSIHDRAGARRETRLLHRRGWR